MQQLRTVCLTKTHTKTHTKIRPKIRTTTHLIRPGFALLIQGLMLALILAWWWQRGRPVDLREPALDAQVLPCVSYAPFRHPEINPFNPVAVVTPAQIEADLLILKARTNCIRTYGLGQGLDALPAIAQRLGMRVKLGVWLARDAAQNWRELERGLALARQFKGTVDLLIVGNEVLLRRELLPGELASYLDYARRHAPVPVTYADVWEFWQRHAALAAHVDLVTVHVLPYWEDDPVAVGSAVAHVHAVAALMRQQFANKPIWIGETGWPAAGRQRAGAVPGQVEQARFVRELLHSTGSTDRTDSTDSAPLDYNLIEGFDQPWKRAFEGAMGGYWGLYDQFGQPRVALIGPVVEDARWWRGPLGAGVGAALGAAFGAALGAALAPLTLAGALLGAIIPVQALALQQWDRTPWEWGTSLLLGALGAALTVAAALRLERAGAMLRLAILFCAASVALILLFDARYRPFPWWWFAAPAASLWAWRAGGTDGGTAGGTNWQRPCREEWLLAGILAAGAAAVAVIEGWRNAQALAFCLLQMGLAASVLPAWRTRASSASNAAGAHKPAV